MADAGQVLLDVVDTRKRLVQHGLLVAAIGMLVAARFVADVNAIAAVGAIVVAVALFGAAASVWQRWSIDYEGYRIVFENNPLNGERLRIGGVVVANGQRGVTSHMHATIATSFGAEQILVRTDADFLQFRCVIRAVRCAAVTATNAELLTEVRRRGLA